jgi:hypothetical protein
VDVREDLLARKTPRAGRRPFDANQAVATILFERDRSGFHSHYPGLCIQHLRRMACAAYPLSGGFDHPSLLPQWLVTPMLRLEHHLEKLGRFLAFRLFVVIERRTSAE